MPSSVFLERGEPLAVRVLIISDRFAPEVSAVSVRSLAHAKIWRDLGHDVAVVTCAPNFPKGQVFEGYENRLYQEDDVEGVKVLRIWSYMAANEGIVKRIFDYLSFLFSAVFLCRRFPDFDIILATSPPIFVAFAGAAVAWRRRKPWVFEVRDLWPASIRAVGVSKSPLLKLVEKLELALYRGADRVMVLTRSFKEDLVSRGIDGEKIDVVTNGVDLAQFRLPGSNNRVRAELGVSDDALLVGYIGTTGLAHGLSTLVEAAERCAARSDIVFLIMGEGADRKSLESAVAEKGLKNVIFRDFVGHDEVVDYISSLDLSVVHLRPDPVFHAVIPSKIFENMALGVPLLMAVEGESAEIVMEAGCGVCISSGDSAMMAEAVLRLADEREELAEMGQRGLKAVAEKFDRIVLAAAAAESLEEAIASKKGAAS